MTPLAKDFYTRVKDAVKETSAMERMSDLLQKHTRLLGRSYSFKDHEYQIDICNSTHHNLVGIKPSQVGFTTFTYYSLLMMLAVTPEMVGILALPTVQDAQRMAKSRIDPIISGSKYLRERLSNGSDSASFKQIGTSQLFMTGTQKPLISIPCDLLIVDELDFCVKENLITAESRMSHSRFVDPTTRLRGVRRRFSTPTANGIGVAALYEQSDQRKRLVKCQACSLWFWPDFLTHCVVDGFDQSFTEMTYLDVIDLENRGLVDTCRLLCPGCRREVTQANLHHDNREWVATYPERKTVEGWQVSPFDLPAHHSPPSILRYMDKYRGEVGHFRNFVLGLPHDDESNSVVDQIVESNVVLRPIPPEEAVSQGVSSTIMGLDVGMTSWLTIARVMNRETHILWFEAIRLKGQNGEGLLEVVKERMGQYKVVKAVMDALPYTDTALKLQAAAFEECLYPCMYTLRDGKLPAQKIRVSDNLLEAHRTKTLNRVANQINQGLIKFPLMEETRVVRRHLQGMKRVDHIDTAGEPHSDWVKGDGTDDHYFHSINYLLMARAMFDENYLGWSPMPSVVGAEVGRLAVKSHSVI